MKAIHTYFLAILLVGLFSACKRNQPEPNEDTQNQIIEALQGVWSLVEVRKDNVLISDFANFSLIISDKSYSSQNGTPVWPANGSFDFENQESEDQFIRQDGRLFTAKVTNINTLIITIIYQQEAARGENGTYEFILQKE
jgi:hypothetical protein